MFDALRIFEVREPIAEDYQVPALDTVGTGNALIVLPPPAPIVLSVDATDLIWENMLNVTGFVVESLGAGNIWSIVATLPPAPSVRILWTGVEWQIQKEVGNTWEVFYRGFQPLVPGSIVGDTALYQTILTPDLIPTWYLLDGVTVATGVGVTRGGILDPNGMQVVGASDSTLNVSYDMPGPQNGRNSYSGPELYDYSSSFAASTYFRVRALNSAGESSPSNIVEWLNTVATNSGDVNNYAIAGYVDGFIPNTTSNPPSGQPVWDGSFTFGYPDNLFPGLYGGWSNGDDSGYVPQAINGNLASCAEIYFGVSTVDNVTPAYVLQVWADLPIIGFGIVWSGNKLTGSNAAGVYVNDGTGVDSVTPATITVEQIAGNNDLTYGCSNCAGS